MFPSKTASQSPPPTRTFTPTKDPCNGISLSGFDLSDKDKPNLIIFNSRPEKIIITYILIYWPKEEHKELEEIKLGKDKIWDNSGDGDGDDPPTDIPPPPWPSPPDKRDIKPTENKKLEFRFKENAGGATLADYYLVITFEISGTGLFCTMSP
jgi:hypothetical protein